MSLFQFVWKHSVIGNNQFVPYTPSLQLTKQKDKTKQNKNLKLPLFRTVARQWMSYRSPCFSVWLEKSLSSLFLRFSLWLIEKERCGFSFARNSTFVLSLVFNIDANRFDNRTGGFIKSLEICKLVFRPGKRIWKISLGKMKEKSTQQFFQAGSKL